ncbi:hypothetical protein P3W85_28265 [Cupriavidus basilensis]|uniref:Uncharacterized protein n=1 Tax=Cupriavidus basilensis TaxID=68895 RepID=A0ABT6AW28_9BURK|nr:hypothetical protein [Cupriavidus basilensis]MDF3836815.1 hypothetical protein [Cupriavidus basilensis]
MDPINKLDRALGLLRVRLAENQAKAQAGTAARQDQVLQSDPQRSRKTDRAGLLKRIETLRQFGVLDEAELQRAAVGYLLSEQFGDAFVNVPEFQLVVSMVHEELTRDTELGAALDTLITGR